MPNNRPIPQTDTKAYAEPGTVTFKTKDKNVTIEMWHCTAYINDEEAFRALLSFHQACHKAWGPSFTEGLMEYLSCEFNIG